MNAHRPYRADHRGRHRRVWATILLLGGLVGLSGFMGVGPHRAAAASTSPISIAVGQTSGLTDGTPVPVTVTSSNPKADPVGWVQSELCQANIDYTSFAVVETRGNCGFSPGSSAYTSPDGSSTQSYPGEPGGARSFPDNFIVGVGTATFAGFNLTCDPKHPCDLVVSVFASQTDLFEESAEAVQAFPLTFLSSHSIAGCSGIAGDALQTVSSDRLVEAYEDWSRQACTSDGPGGGKAPTENTFVDEGGAFGAVDNFSSGSADLAYAAGGYDLPGFAVKDGRPYVAVPVALNAVVVAASGGQEVPAYTPPGSPTMTTSSPFTKLELTASQAGSLFGGGYVSTSQSKAIVAENPVLGAAPRLVPYSPPGSSTFVYPQAVAGVNATTVFASTYFTDIAGHAWNSGPYATKGKPTNVDRGVISSFAQPGPKEPAFTSLYLYSHRTDLERSALPYLGVGPDPLWVLSDRATASELGFATASLGNNAGTSYVAPTEATMDAAVADMTTEKDGTLLPDPVKAAASKTPAYPLTFVEYALAPAEPLLTASCQPRAASQALLTQWLTFLTTKGQTGLAAGLEPLTPALAAEAKADIAKVGASAVTGTCAPPTTTTTTGGTTTTTTTAGAPGSTSSDDGVPTDTTLPGGDSSSTTVAGSTGAGHSATRGSTTTTTRGSAGTGKLAATKLPLLTSSSSTGWLLPSAALVLLGLLTGGMALRASGRSPLLMLAALGRRIRSHGGGGAP